MKFEHTANTYLLTHLSAYHVQRELEMSTNHQDGGKLKLEKLLQCEVEQQQAKTDLHRMTLRNLATNGMFNGTMRLMQPGPPVIVQVLF